MKYIYTLLFTCLFFYGNGQKNIDNVFQKQSINLLSSEEVKNNIGSIPSSQLLYLSDTKAAELFNTTENFTFQIPTKTASIEVEIKRATIFSSDFKVMTPNGEATDVELPHYYHGKIKGDAKSFVALMITKDAVEGMITSDKVNLTIGRVKNLKEKMHSVYNTIDIPNTTPICSEPIELGYTGEPVKETPSNEVANAACRSLKVYLEADNQMFLDLGSTNQAVVNHMTAIFNNVSLLYQNEGVNLVISTLFVWTTPDPYRTATSTSQSLNLLDAYWNTQGNNFNGNIVQMVTTKQLGGGVASYYTGGPPSVFNNMTERAIFFSCNKADAFGMSGNITTSVVNLPTYSWNVMVIAHEIGHNCGLPHTHSCTWSDGTTTGAIDNCAATEGGCTGATIPAGGGTIMSYCHQQGVGINFANGFGTLPGGKLRAEINAATCLGGAALVAPTVQNVTVCTGNNTAVLVANCGTLDLKWYNAATNGTLIGNGNNFSLPNVTANRTVYAECSSTACGTSPRSPLQISFLAECVITYCQPTGLNCSDNDRISQVKINQGAANLYSSAVTTCSAGGYSLTTPATEVSLQTGQTYQLTTSGPGAFPNGLSIWIDYNRNGTFETAERVESNFPAAPWTQRLTSITIPATATAGLTRIRFKVSYNMLSNDPCSSTDGDGYGEIEDYIVRISGGTPCPPSLTHAVGVLPAGNYNAGQNITSRANVSTPTKYQAGKNITLNAGFQAGPNEVFEAKIGGCPQ